MMPIVAVTGCLVFFAVLAGTRAVREVLLRRAILDHPNERSSHSLPTPRGGGIAVVGVLAPCWIAWSFLSPEFGASLPAPAGLSAVALGALALAAISFADDLRPLPAALRLAVQAAVVATLLAVVPPPAPVFQGLLPDALDLIAAGVLWVWFLNLFNFMDGIDGIAGVESAAIGIGVALVAATTQTPAPATLPAVALAAAAAGFLWWNWHPARIFLGDVGSVPLGLMAGWLLLELAAAGQWAAALIIPAYYLADATITILRRALRGERVWRAHREHFYQRAVRHGRSHAAVSGRIALANAALVALAVVAAAPSPAWSPAWSVAALAVAAVVVGALLRWMTR